LSMKHLSQMVFPFPFIKQAGFMECGTTCLAMVFKYYGYYDIRGFLTERAGVNTEGIDLYTLSELAEGFGFETDGYKLGFENLKEVQLPCIAHYEGNHFVVIYKANANKVWIADPAIGRYELTKDEFLKRWNGIVLTLNPTKKTLQELLHRTPFKFKKKAFRNIVCNALSANTWIGPALLHTGHYRPGIGKREPKTFVCHTGRNDCGFYHTDNAYIRSKYIIDKLQSNF
jgi:ABC-type bacteriocin/lantibiotic exporter with double-glycine peptidase domain